MRMAASLQAKHPGATASLKEGLEETLTLQAMGISGALYRTLRTTKSAGEPERIDRALPRNVKRWKDGVMILPPGATPWTK